MLDPSDIDNMNEYFFETMHHEFGHILDNNRLHPTPFNILSNGRYNAAGWNETPDSVAASQGFVSNYASMSYTEDWVETFARYITRDSITWQKMFETAKYEWETLDLKDVIKDRNNDNTVDEVDYDDYISGTIDIDTIGYFKEDESGKDEHKIYRRVCKRDAEGFVVPGDDGLPQWKENVTSAAQVITTKLDYVREYMKEQFGIDIDTLRNEVQNKQFVRDASGKFKEVIYLNPFTKRNEPRLVNAITEVDPVTGKSALDVLLDELEAYKELQNN
jgi:hypothetical protein